jgi:hypothetical protein
MLKRPVDNPETQPGRVQTDPTLPLQRLRDMGFPIPIQPDAGWLSTSQLFPWHSILILNSPERTASGGAEHLGLVLARRRYGLTFDVANNARPAHILCCNLPVGTPDDAAEMLCEEAIAYRGNRREALRLSALHGLAQLEFRSRFAPMIRRGRFLRAVHALDIKAEDDATRAALRLIALHGLDEAIEFVRRAALLENPDSRLSAIDTLLWLGEPGMAAFQGLIGQAQGDALRTFKAVASGLEHDLDSMHALITSKEWSERNGALRVLRSLVVKKGVAPEGPLEIILSRYRDDHDCDNRNSIGSCLADVIAHMGPAAIDPVVALVAELQGDSEALLNGIIHGGAPGMTIAAIHELETTVPHIQRRFRSAIHRLMAVASPDYPARIDDWLESETVQAVQWGCPVPARIQTWLEDASTIPDWQIIDTLLHGRRWTHAGSLASAALLVSPALATTLECLAPRLMNRGADHQWSGIVCLLASAWTPNEIPKSWMRVALGGLAAGPLLSGSPENIGGLLAVAASGLDTGSDHALGLLAAMPGDVRTLAIHFLRTSPVGIAALQGEACNPPDTGFGPRGKEFPGLGVVRRTPSIAHLDASCQQFLGDRPATWMTPDQVVQQLIRSARKAEKSFLGNLWTWDEEDTRRLIVGFPPILIQQAIVSIHVAGGCPKITGRLVKALGPEAAQGDLGPLVSAATQDTPDEDEDPDGDELETILGLP